MGSKSAPEVIGSLVAALCVWAIVLMAASLVFTLAWNGCAPAIFGMMPIRSLESLCMLSCVWIVSRIVLPKVTVESRA